VRAGERRAVERRMVETFHTVLSRGERAEYLRVLSKTWPEAEMQRLIVDASAGVDGGSEGSALRV
jgi:hypothetical protein